MKKLALLFLAAILAISLSACNNLPDDLTDCLANPDGEGCPVVCPAGQELDINTATCVPVDDGCPDGQHDESGVCVIDDTRTLQEITLDFITDGFEDDGGIEFLGTTLTAMDFSSAQTITTDIQFAVTEDIDETHYFSGQIIDSMLEDETNGNMLQRQIILDVDDEFDIDFTIIYHEVSGGVHVYLETGVLLDAIEVDSPDAIEIMEWIGFDKAWAVFEFDDSLEAVIQVEVLKDMLVELFFSEVGEAYFTEVQNELEDEIGFDLNQYGLDLGLLMDELIEEDFDTVETMIEAIDFEGIALHFDAVNIAPELYQTLMDEDNLQLLADLGIAGLDTSKLLLLDTATYHPYVPDNTSTPEYDPIYSHFVAYDPIDPAKGTQAFFESLDEDDIDAIIEVIVKPGLSTMAYHELMDELDTYYLKQDFRNILYEYQYKIYSIADTPFYTDGSYTSFSNLIAELDSEGVLDFYENMTSAQHTYIRSLIANNPSEYSQDWQWEALDNIDERIALELDVAAWLVDHTDELLAMGYLQADIEQWLIDIPVDGLEVWYDDLPEDVLALALEQEVYERVEAFILAVEGEEGPEWLMNEFFGNVHVTQALLDSEGNPLFDEDIIALNLMSIDFDALVLELLDIEELATAVYEGPAAFATYLTSLEVASPNYAAFLEVLTPGVASMEEYMIYVTDVMYAFDGLEVFEDLIDPVYYLDDILDVEVTVTEDSEVLTVFDIDGLSYATLFSDVTSNLGVYFDGFETIEDNPYDINWVCLDPLDEDCDDLDLPSIIAELSILGSTEAYVLMDPMDPTWFELGIDFTDLFNGLVVAEYAKLAAEEGYVADEDNGDLTGVTEMSITISVVDEATITLPLTTETADVNSIVEDVAKFAMTMEAYEYLEDVAYMFMNNPLLLADYYNTNVALEDINGVRFSEAFDHELSYISINIDEVGGVPVLTTLDYEIVLNWLDGTLVFNSSVGMADIAALMLDGDLVSQVAYQTMVDKVAVSNWHTTKLFMVYLLEEEMYD